jgi:hypothetical protein
MIDIIEAEKKQFLAALNHSHPLADDVFQQMRHHHPLRMASPAFNPCVVDLFATVYVVRNYSSADTADIEDDSDS